MVRGFAGAGSCPRPDARIATRASSPPRLSHHSRGIPRPPRFRHGSRGRRIGRASWRPHAGCRRRRRAKPAGSKAPPRWPSWGRRVPAPVRRLANRGTRSREKPRNKVVTVHRRIGLVSQPVEEWDALSTQVIHWKLHSTHRKEQLRTLTELRLAIEPAAAISAARYAPIDVKSRLPLLAAELRHTGENGRLDEFHKLDIEFHSLILRNSGNEMFASLSTIITTVLSGRVELHMYPQKPKLGSPRRTRRRRPSDLAEQSGQRAPGHAPHRRRSRRNAAAQLTHTSAPHPEQFLVAP